MLFVSLFDTYLQNSHQAETRDGRGLTAFLGSVRLTAKLTTSELWKLTDFFAAVFCSRSRVWMGLCSRLTELRTIVLLFVFKNVNRKAKKTTNLARLIDLDLELGQKLATFLTERFNRSEVKIWRATEHLKP